mmetsp:Transcript_15094/g.31712  ORF Transcript_15094/g.31712 Transcript_15094/m.31712 type:complete len:106 (-) Transcript_15094:837-1154(-)
MLQYSRESMIRSAEFSSSKKSFLIIISLSNEQLGFASKFAIASPSPRKLILLDKRSRILGVDLGRELKAVTNADKSMCEMLLRPRRIAVIGKRLLANNFPNILQL